MTQLMPFLSAPRAAILVAQRYLIIRISSAPPQGVTAITTPTTTPTVTTPPKKSRTTLYVVALIVIIVIAGVAAYALGLFGTGGPACTNSYTINAINNSTNPLGYSFSPAKVTYSLGTAGCVKVTWHNNSNFNTHTVTSDGASWTFDVTLSQNRTYTFNTPGTYRYHCTPHLPYMNGTIIITS